VVLACHADQALAMLSDASPEERRVLSCFRYSRNRAVLHRDQSLMPKRRSLWASWNYLSGLPPLADGASSVTYWMNKLQPLSVDVPLFVSLNPLTEPEVDKVLGEFDYTHPIFDPAAMAAQRDMWTIQGAQRTWFCGAYMGSGFHEDGIQAGLAVAESLGSLKRPWSVADESGRIHLGPQDPRSPPVQVPVD
jgi:predicted NAD/FAD-binding protein